MGEYGKKLYELQNKVVINVKQLKFGLEEVEVFFFWGGGGHRNTSPLLYFIFLESELIYDWRLLFFQRNNAR
jgi:hypothetical protein